DSTLTPTWPSRANRSTTHRVGDFSLVDQSGTGVTRSAVAGRVYVASFFYADCRTLCPNLRAGLGRVADAFAADTGVMILSHSVLPEQDTPAKLAEYAAHNRIDGT